jgi:glycosyltransferase involved in cell wall biosynthesis
MPIRVSVVVPVYNVRSYLAECLESILSQTLEEMEIIVLDDGSTDGSGAVIDAYCSKDERVRAYAHPNIGAGPTRNRGIELAKGEYIAFADADDRVDGELLRLLYERAKETGADVVSGSVTLFLDGQEPRLPKRQSPAPPDICLNANNLAAFYRDHFFSERYHGYCVGALYSRSFLQGNFIRFGDDRRVSSEDRWFQYQILMTRARIAYAPEAHYFYRQRTGSLLNRPMDDDAIRLAALFTDHERLIAASPNQGIHHLALAITGVGQIAAHAYRGHRCGMSEKDWRLRLRDLFERIDLRACAIAYTKEKAYRLIASKPRAVYYAVLSLLYRVKWDGVAAFLIWRVSKRRLKAHRKQGKVAPLATLRQRAE